jgi:hypothetical protein
MGGDAASCAVRVTLGFSAALPWIGRLFLLALTAIVFIPWIGRLFLLALTAIVFMFIIQSRLWLHIMSILGIDTPVANALAINADVHAQLVPEPRGRNRARSVGPGVVSVRLRGGN